MMAPQAERSFGWRRPEKNRLDESFNETHESAQTGTTPTKEHKKVVVEFNVLPWAITFEPQGEVEHAELEFVTRAFDMKGKSVGETQATTVTADLKPAIYKEEHYDRHAGSEG